jgi:hypothetical protein
MQFFFRPHDLLIYNLVRKNVSILKNTQSSMKYNVITNSDELRMWKESDHDLFQVTIAKNWEGYWEKPRKLQLWYSLFRLSFESGACQMQVSATTERLRCVGCRDCQRQRVAVSFTSLSSDVKLPHLEAQEFVCLTFPSKGSEEACGLANGLAVRTNCRLTATDKSRG